MFQTQTFFILWELYNYYSMLSFVYNSYYYARMSLYYYNKCKEYMSGTQINKPNIDIQLTTFEDWEIIDTF